MAPGLLTKLCNQIIAGCTISVVAEAVNFAEKSGVDAAALTEALKGGFADSIPFQIFGPRMAARDFENLGGHNGDDDKGFAVGDKRRRSNRCQNADDRSVLAHTARRSKPTVTRRATFNYHPLFRSLTGLRFLILPRKASRLDCDYLKDLAVSGSHNAISGSRNTAMISNICASTNAITPE